VEVETKKKSCWFNLEIVLLILIVIVIVAIVFITGCAEVSIGKAAADSAIESANANIEAENRYLSETSGISKGIKAVYENFQNSVDDYNKGFLTLEGFKVDSIEFYAGVYTAVDAFDSLEAPVPESLSDYNQYFSKFILEWQKIANHMKSFIKSASNKDMQSELKAVADCVKAANGYIEAANIELNKIKLEETAAAQTTVQEEKNTETELTNIIKYNIIYTVDNARFDGGTRYYLLINPIDLSNDNFKDGIKGIIRRFIKIHSNKVSINIYDKLETLENDYKDTEKSNTAVSTDPEFLKDIELHLIAYYDGDLSAGLYLNTLQFFPAYYEDNPVIEKYLEILEFNP